MGRRTAKSAAAFARAQKVLVGGVNSPVRSFAAVGGEPPLIARAKGSKITDVDDNTYIDYVGSYGPSILGHAPEPVVTAINKAARHGASYGAPTESETKLAEAVTAALPSIEKIRFVSSGTEAAMSAVRLARGATGRAKVVKCIGGYHGHADAMLVSAGSGATTLGVPSCPGIPVGAAADTILTPYNDLAAMQEVFGESGETIAAVLVEPVAANMGVVPPAEGYLAGLRNVCDAHGAMLIFDEVITGFRLSYGGAQSLYGVRPDVTILGKIIGGGMPIGAFGGAAGIMSRLAPEGEVYQAGTLSGNPVTMAAGLATLQALQAEGFYESLEERSAALGLGLEAAAREADLADKVCINRVGSMLSCFFAPPPVTDYAGATVANTKAYATYFHAMLDAGIYLAPSQFEAMFVSAAHSDDDITQTASASAKALRAAARLMA
ncbi:MAG: glutamate-1-semialdehyde 2,1-aminomutase [Planctomycetota bacterium]|nr:glutamate-1-semialdehyde 2,1-aminomutase [Planctomycetota bacterium]